MKYQALFSSKDKSKKLKYRLLQFLFGAFKVNLWTPLLSKNCNKSILLSGNVLETCRGIIICQTDSVDPKSKCFLRNILV